MILLSIDTSFDDTAVAITDGLKILSNVISSQARYHKKFGGAVPFLAQRLHRERIDSVISMALQRAGLDWSGIEGIAVTYGPGLAPTLEVGLAKAKELSVQHNLPLYPVNHMAGHIASCFGPKRTIEFPALALLVSGGHTELVLMKEFGDFEILGETLDDAVGESFDKVAKMLGLGYPGGTIVSKLADAGDPSVYALPVPMVKSKNLNFSYSGLKNAVRLLIYEVKGGTHTHVLERSEMENICASFQEVALKSLVIKVGLALREHPEVKSLLLAGGVARNVTLRGKLRKLVKEADVAFWAPVTQVLCTDNAAMIGLAAGLGIAVGQKPVSAEEIDRKPTLRLDGK